MKRLVLGLVILVTSLGSLVACSANVQKDAQVNVENESATTVIVETTAQVVEKVPDVDGEDSVQSKFMVGGNNNITKNYDGNVKTELDDKIKDNANWLHSFSEGDDFSLYNGMTWGTNIEDVMKDFGQAKIIDVERTRDALINTFPGAVNDLKKINDGDLNIIYIYDQYSIAMYFDKNTRGLKVICYMINFY